MEFSQELIKKTKECKTVEELMALAQENELELSAEDAELLLQDFAEGELTDEELDNVAGGGCAKPANPYENYIWKNKDNVQFIFNIGDSVQAFALGCSHHTATCTVTNREARGVYNVSTSASGNTSVSTLIGYADYYYLEKVPGGRSVFINGWNRRAAIEK